MEQGLDPAAAWIRHTPDTARVRILTGGVFLVGLLTVLPGALLQMWFLQLGISSLAAGHSFLALSLGILTAVELLSKFVGPRSGSAYLLVSGILACLSLAALSKASAAFWLLPGLFGLGAAAGTLAVALTYLLRALLTPVSQSTVLPLAGLCFGAGAVTSCVLVWSMIGALPLSVVVLGIAILPACWTALVWRGRRDFPSVQTNAGAVVRGSLWKQAANPVSVLLGVSLCLQAAGSWAAGGWLTLYLTRKYGVSPDTAVFALSLYWLALTCGAVLAVSLAPLEERGRPVVFATAGIAVGCAFLLKPIDTSALASGALLLGGGTGMMHSILVRLIGKRCSVSASSLVRPYFLVCLSGGLLGPFLVGPLAEPFGIEVVIWFTLGAAAFVFLALNIVFLEMRLTSPRVAVE